MIESLQQIWGERKNQGWYQPVWWKVSYKLFQIFNVICHKYHLPSLSRRTEERTEPRIARRGGKAVIQESVSGSSGASGTGWLTPVPPSVTFTLFRLNINLINRHCLSIRLPWYRCGCPGPDQSNAKVG